MSASDDDKPVDRPPTPDFSAQVADLPKSLPPKRGRGRPRKNPPAAKAAVVEPEPEPAAKPPSPPPCPHVKPLSSPPLPVDSDSESEVETKPEDKYRVGGRSNAVKHVDDLHTPSAGFVRQHDEDALLENIIDTQNEGLRVLNQENVQLRAHIAKLTSDPAFEDPDHTWDIYLVGAASGLAVGVLLRRLAALMF